MDSMFGVHACAYPNSNQRAIWRLDAARMNKMLAGSVTWNTPHGLRFGCRGAVYLGVRRMRRTRDMEP